MEYDQLDFIAELVFSREDFVRLEDDFVVDVVGAVGLKGLGQRGHLKKNLGCLLLGR